MYTAGIPHTVGLKPRTLLVLGHNANLRPPCRMRLRWLSRQPRKEEFWLIWEDGSSFPPLHLLPLSSFSLLSNGGSWWEAVGVV